MLFRSKSTKFLSCATWEKFSTFIEWFVQKEAKIGLSLHYLDDYLFIGKNNTMECSILLETFHKACQQLQVPIAHEKTEGPVNKLVFLGLQIDTNEETVTIPKDKVEEIIQKLK